MNRTDNHAFPQGQAIGKRAQNKRDKLGRLCEAARALFLEHGYDNTTTREVARRAGIGMGTLFAYASDKRDLLFLIFNDQLEAMAATPFLDIAPGQTMAGQIAASFRPFFVFYAGQPDLARFMLRELEFYNSGPQAQRFRAARRVLLEQIATRIGIWQQAGLLRADLSQDDAARAVLALYSASVRDYLAVPEPDMEDGLAALARLLALLVRGLA